MYYVLSINKYCRELVFGVKSFCPFLVRARDHVDGPTNECKGCHEMGQIEFFISSRHIVTQTVFEYCFECHFRMPFKCIKWFRPEVNAKCNLFFFPFFSFRSNISVNMLRHRQRKITARQNETVK